jgi:hypothetical protein
MTAAKLKGIVSSFALCYSIISFFSLPPPPPPSGIPIGKRHSSNGGSSSVKVKRSDQSLPIHDGYGDIELDSRYLKNDNDLATIAGKKHRAQQYLSTYSDPSSSSTDVEWTPEDSSYGAAIPVCGCIPKHIRRMIEYCLCIILLLSFISGVIRLTSTFSHSSSQSSYATNATSSSRTGKSGSSSSGAAQKISNKYVIDDFYLEYDANNVANNNNDDRKQFYYDDLDDTQTTNTSYYSNNEQG